MTKPTHPIRIALVALLAVAVLFVCVTALARDAGGEPAPRSSIVLAHGAFAVEGDRIIPAPPQHLFAGRAGATTSPLLPSHVPTVLYPDVSADLTTAAAQTVVPGN